MKKLLNLFKWIDNNFFHVSMLAFIVLTSLLPKIPLAPIAYTYIRMRYDDILPPVIGVIFLLALLRRKIRFNTKFLIPIVLFWVAVFASFAVGYFLQKTVPVRNLGLLNALRRVEYMGIFFIATAAITSEKRFKQYMFVYIATIVVVSIYGIGQRFLGFPSIQTMNPAYVDGRLLILNPEDRINSTFGGHFDLAAYLGFSIPILLGFFFVYKQIRYFLVYVLALITLLYTAARSSFAGYVISVTIFLMYLRKFRFFLVVLVLTGVLTFVTGDLAKRIGDTFQMKIVFVNTQTGGTKIDQKLSTKQLPAGGYKVPIVNNIINNPGSTNGNSATASAKEIQTVAIQEALEEAKSKGQYYNSQTLMQRANEISKHIQPQRTLLCDISCATRLQIEWPRAIAAFTWNPVFGSGPSSITEATDNDFLRWLGETGLLGTALFMWILIAIMLYVKRAIPHIEKSERYIYWGFIFGTIALLLNGLYLDVFEASKVAYNFWMIAGFYVGVIPLITKETSKNKK